MRTYPILKAASARPGCSWWAFLASSIASKTQKGVSLFYLHISTLKKQKAIYSLKESYNQVCKKKIYIYILYIYIYIYIYTQWVRKVFRPPYIFHSLLYCNHMLKSFKFIFFLINVHTAPHIDRKTQNC